MKSQLNVLVQDFLLEQSKCCTSQFRATRQWTVFTLKMNTYHKDKKSENEANIDLLCATYLYQLLKF